MIMSCQETLPEKCGNKIEFFVNLQPFKPSINKVVNFFLKALARDKWHKAIGAWQSKTEIGSCRK